MRRGPFRPFVAAAGAALLLGGALPAAQARPVPCPVGGVDITRAPYAARGDGATDASAAFQAAIDDPKVRLICLPPGEYLFSQQVLLRTGLDLGLLGLSTEPGDTRIVWKTDVIPFYSSPTRGLQTRIRRFTVRNLTFDGNRTNGRAFNLLAAPDAAGDSTVEIENSIIRNTLNLPVWIEGFSRVRITRSKFSGTKDPGILRSSNVEIVDNEVENSSDNCLSISRGNSKVRIADNRLRNCHSAGIFVGGINYEGKGNRSFELDAAAGARPGTACVIRSTEADHFRYGMIGTNLTLKRGDEFVIVKITGWNEGDRSSAPCEVATPVPASLARTPTGEWADGPHFGGDETVIERNRIEGSLGHGITISMGAHGVRVRGNEIRGSGRFVETDGSVKEGNAFGVLVVGWYLGPQNAAQRYAEDIEVVDNAIVGPTTGGIRLGSEVTGGVRRVTVRDNRIDLTGTSANIGILVDRHRNMPGDANRVVGNEVAFSGNKGRHIALRIDHPADEVCDVMVQADVPRMSQGDCALQVGHDCRARQAPAALGCAGRGRPGR